MKRGFVFGLRFAFVFTIALTGCSDDVVSDLTLDDSLTAERRPQTNAAGAVYLLDNNVAGNNLIVFDRAADGTLNNQRTYATDGAGTGGGLGSQGAVIRYRDYLLAVNAGSHEISVFKVGGQGLTLTDVEPSRGMMPTSLTASRNLVYVLNAGGTGNIAGFRLNEQGDLSFIPGSVQALSSSAAAAAQVSFNSTGRLLVVTERATNAISVYPVNHSGVAGARTTFASAGATPFGFEFGQRDQVFVSEAFGGAPGASTVSAYALQPNGNLQLIMGPVPTHQTAACWLVVTNNGRFTYTTNTGSSSVSGYRITPSGGLQLLNSDGITGSTGAGPIDADLSRNSNYLYTLNAGSDSITMFAVGEDGSLYNLGEITGLPNGAVGLAAE